MKKIYYYFIMTGVAMSGAFTLGIIIGAIIFVMKTLMRY